MNLLENPFHILNTTPQDTRHRIMELADERSLFIDESECRAARSTLTHPRNRLSAEMAWIPGIGPIRTIRVLKILESSERNLEGMFNALMRCSMEISDETGNIQQDLFGMDKLIPLSRANLLASGLSGMSEYTSHDIVEGMRWANPLSSLPTTVKWILEIAQAFEDINPDEVRATINEERRESGFPEITDRTAIEEEIRNRRHHYRQVIELALADVSIMELARVVTLIVDAATGNAENPGIILIDDLVDSYEVDAKESLEDGEKVLEVMEKKLREAADAKRPDSTLVLIVNPLIEHLKNWDTIAQPIQVSKKSRGERHEASHRVAMCVRGLAIDLFNKYGKLDFSRQLINMLQEVFAEVGEVAERLADDAKALNKIDEERVRLIESLEKWEDIKAQVEKLRAAADANTPDTTLVPMVNQLAQTVKKWNALAQPLEANYGVTGIVRELLLHLWNEHNKLDFALQLTNILQEVFAGVPEIANRIADDAKALNKIDEERVRLIESLEKWEDIKAQVEKLRTAADANTPDTTLVPMVNQLAQTVKKWNALAQPLETNYGVTGIVRELSLHLWNEHNKLDFALQLTNILQEVFAGVPEIANRIADDKSALDKIAEERTRLIERRKENAAKGWGCLILIIIGILAALFENC